MAKVEGDASAKARHGVRLCLAREPSAKELAIYLSLYEKALAKYSQNSDLAMKMATQPLGPPPKGANVAELAAWTVIGSTLLNLDEMFLKR